MKNAPAGWKLKSSKKVYDNFYLKVYEDVLDLAGRDKLYIRARRPDYSTIVPFSHDGRILTIKSYRHLVDSWQLEVPAGYIEKGETARHAAIRELEEETGYRAKKMVHVGSYTLDYSMFAQTGNVFAAYGIEKSGRQNLGRMEKIEIEFVPIEKMKQMLLKGRILNAASIVALYQAIQYHESRK
ncbi:NUDIX hydrolase [Nitrososphaera sp.]|uniref:NUDIX hydrolase n=1 Tax=Nitrososphaera sp. TaxID=1971748 RepID=UPI0017AF9A86|nr:NUDIX hydrolase [Nitrososphaera sp.]NWG36549.1 NUDIX hydrolase [Nitrososphaera sp.]